MIREIEEILRRHCYAASARRCAHGVGHEIGDDALDLTAIDRHRWQLGWEIDLLKDIIVKGMSVIDIGCGTGRHLIALRDRLRIGVGVDYEHAYVVEARLRAGAGRLHFVAGDATALPIRARLDFAMCVTNTWGNCAANEYCQ